VSAAGELVLGIVACALPLLFLLDLMLDPPDHDQR